jgi:cell fate (sporulation/competence/biofilm development) regulator YlbF (YheA/YmcA/DUF963 family)
VVEDGDLRRLVRDMEDLAVRVREIENVQNPIAKQLVVEFREVQKRVHDMDLHGTTITQVRLKGMEDTIEDLVEDAKSSRTFLKSALVTAALSIGVQIIVGTILFVLVNRGGG